MGLLTNLFKLVQPTLPAGYCPTSYQQLTDDLIGGTQVTFLIDTGNFLYNYGSSTPAPENRIFPWYCTLDNLWYNFQYGLWVSPVAPRDTVDGFRQMYLPAAGTLISTVWSLDSGDGTDGQPYLADNTTPNPAYVAPTATTGAMWIVDYAMNGRFPLGAGIIPDSDLGSGDASVGIAQTIDSFGREGEYAHLLTEDEGAVGQHDHPFGLANPGNNDAFFNQLNAPVATPTWNGYYITGSGSGSTIIAETTADLSTLPSNDGYGKVSDKHNTMPPYMGVWWLKHTSRRYYTRPA
jgi:hypothetical protein